MEFVKRRQAVADMHRYCGQTNERGDGARNSGGGGMNDKNHCMNAFFRFQCKMGFNIPMSKQLCSVKNDYRKSNNVYNILWMLAYLVSEIVQKCVVNFVSLLKTSNKNRIVEICFRWWTSSCNECYTWACVRCDSTTIQIWDSGAGLGNKSLISWG